MRKPAALKTLSLSVAGLSFVVSSHALPMGTAMVGGMAQFDHVNFAGDKSTVAKTSGDVRRAKIWVKGNLEDTWSYQLGYDARNNELDNTWVGYNGFDPFWLAFGYIDAPQSLEFWSGYVNDTFMEYAIPVFAFEPPRGIGLYIDGIAAKDMLSYQAAVYVPDIREDSRVTSSTRHSAQGDSSDEWGYAGRVVVRPPLDLGNVFALGASARYEGVASDENINALVGIPGLLGDVSATRGNVLVNSVNPAAGDLKGITVYGLESALLWGSFTGQAEYMKTFWDGRAGASSLSFWGWYAQAAYLLTGEKRAYDDYSGTVGSVESIDHNYGAWEMAARFGYVDLSDNPSNGSFTDTDNKRGKLRDITVGLNWYVNANIKFQANYVYSHADYNTTLSDKYVKAFGFRGQVAF